MSTVTIVAIVVVGALAVGMLTLRRRQLQRRFDLEVQTALLTHALGYLRPRLLGVPERASDVVHPAVVPIDLRGRLLAPGV